MLFECPGIRIPIFSTGKRASGSLLEIVLMLIDNLGEEFNQRIIRSAGEQLFIAGAALSDGASTRGAEAKKLFSSKFTSKMASDKHIDERKRE